FSKLRSYMSDIRVSVKHQNILDAKNYNSMLKTHITSLKDEIKVIQSAFPELRSKLSSYEARISEISKKQDISVTDLMGQINSLGSDIEKFMDKKTAKKEVSTVRTKINEVRSTLSDSLDVNMGSLRDEINSICSSIEMLNKKLSDGSVSNKKFSEVSSRLDKVSLKSDSIAEDMSSRMSSIESSLDKVGKAGKVTKIEHVSDVDDELQDRVKQLEERLNYVESNEVVKLFSDVPSGKEFCFLSENYEPTGFVARNAVEFIHILRTVDAGVIGFHMKDGSNDYANWFFDVVGDTETADGLRSIEVDYSDLEATRKQILEVLYSVVPFSIV
ncbi:MAG: hypothetical protein KAR23_05660, partial [Candidatus Aenigmarchaeota archaeon]|nr:hypothetical protein [Candidatus Aenigmarchaeota archaeon]